MAIVKFLCAWYDDHALCGTLITRSWLVKKPTHTFAAACPSCWCTGNGVHSSSSHCAIAAAIRRMVGSRASGVSNSGSRISSTSALLLVSFWERDGRW